MARGEMLLLGDEMCKQMDNHKNYDKTYQFEIVFGFQTDTDDFLGLIIDGGGEKKERNKKKNKKKRDEKKKKR